MLETLTETPTETEHDYEATARLLFNALLDLCLEVDAAFSSAGGDDWTETVTHSAIRRVEAMADSTNEALGKAAPALGMAKTDLPWWH